MKKGLAVLFISLVVMTTLFFGCSKQSEDKGRSKIEGSDKSSKKAVRVASYLDSEAEVLGNIVLILLEKNNIPVIDKTKFGTPDVCRKALLEGEIDMLITYTGSGQFWHNDQSDVWSDPEKGYQRIKKLDKEKHNIIWLTPAPANNTEMLCTTKELAKKYNLKSMHDFARYVNEGGKVKLICAQSFADSEYGLKGFEKVYGFKLNDDQLIKLSHGNTAEMLKALAKGTNGVNFSLCYGTDGQIDDLGLYVIEDPESVPPVYLPCPAIRGDVLKIYPQIEEILKPVFQSLTADVLRNLNRQVAFEGKSGKDVAREYLKKKGFI
ncbi:MAG: ABC transporter substrate-binding protein [Actinobacteria bacterium]|nr:ABC transporter substrate-binding protein [Actinomycetota bacterium]